MTYQWPAAPVLSDMAKEPVLDLVPFTGPWWEMANLQFQSNVVRKVSARQNRS
jgi:hypothetical protein